MEPIEIERIHREIDRALAGGAADTHDLPFTDARLVELARAVSSQDSRENNLHQETLRRSLEQRALRVYGSEKNSHSLLASWVGVGLAVAFFVFSAASTLNYQIHPISRALETSYAFPALVQVSSVMQPKSQPHPMELPRPVPTPLAPFSATLGATADTTQASRTPGLVNTSQTP